MVGFRAGLHARTTDAAFDWPVVPPQEPGAADAQSWEVAAPVAHHFAAAQVVLAKHPRAVVFLCSNDDTVKAAAAAAFTPSQLVYADWAGAGRAVRDAGAVAALADWLVLGDAAVVLHTFGSSFGEEAAARTLAPSIRIRRGGHVLGVDMNRPHCNHPLFENADGARDAADELACFEESDAAVCAPPLVKKPCDAAIGAWGLGAVFC